MNQGQALILYFIFSIILYCFAHIFHNDLYALVGAVIITYGIIFPIMKYIEQIEEPMMTRYETRRRAKIMEWKRRRMEEHETL